MSKRVPQFSKDFAIICGLCGNPDRKRLTYLSYFKDVREYFVLRCCQILVCYNCNRSRGKCIACSSDTSAVENRKDEWISRFNTRNNWNELCTTYQFMLPFTGTGKFGTWKNVLDIACRTVQYEHPRYQELFRCYFRFVDDFYSGQMLFYTLRSAPVRNLRLIALQPSQAMSEFFSNLASMAKFSRFSRKTVLNRYQFGFITLLFKRMIGEATPIQAYFFRKLLRYCLAKKASQKLPF